MPLSYVVVRAHLRTFGSEMQVFWGPFRDRETGSNGQNSRTKQTLSVNQLPKTGIVFSKVPVRDPRPSIGVNADTRKSILAAHLSLSLTFYVSLKLAMGRYSSRLG